MEKTEKTLVILTPGFPKDEADSTCLPMQQQLVRRLKANEKGLNIIVLSFQYPYHDNEYSWHGIKVIPFNGRNKGGIHRLLLRRKINEALSRIHHKTPFISLLSFWYGECASIGHRFANTHSLKHYCWILGQDAKKENGYPKRTPLKPTELIALSDFLRESFEMNHGVKPFYLVTPGIEPTLFGTSKNDRNIDIIGVGSLIPLKRFDLFIEILGYLKTKRPGLKAELVGMGPEKEKLQYLVNRAGLQSSITIRGEVAYQKVLTLMQRSKLLLHTSAYEGFSGVCLEALYAGAQVLSFCKPMNADIDQWHIVSNKEEMTQTALQILENPEIAYKKVTFSSMDEVAKKMMGLFL